jgi:hypothetical protein
MEPKKPYEIRKDRFEFIFKINDNIICQRFFKINGFNDQAIYSTELYDTISEIVDILDNDLKSKSRIYVWYMYDKDYIDEEFMAKTNSGIFGNTVFYSNNKYLMPGVYDSQKTVGNTKVYLPNNETTFRFSFCMDGREIITKTWSGDFYPNFVKNSVDISNKKYLFANTNENAMKFDNILLKKMSADRDDLIPIIIKKLCYVCSSSFSNEYDYTTTDEYSGKEYNLNIKEKIKKQ